MNAGTVGPSGGFSHHGRPQKHFKKPLTPEEEREHIEDARFVNRGINAVKHAPSYLYHWGRGTKQAGIGIELQYTSTFPIIVGCTATQRLIDVGLQDRTPFQFNDDKETLIRMYSIVESNPIQNGDTLVSVDHVSTKYLSYLEVVDMLNGYEGTSVELIVQRHPNILLKVRISRHGSVLEACINNLHERLLSLEQQFC